MRDALKRAWFRLSAGLRLVEHFAFELLRPDHLEDDSLPDNIKRDLGLLDGRSGVRRQLSARKSGMPEATRQPQGPL